MDTVALDTYIDAPVAAVWAIVADVGNPEVGRGIADRVEVTVIDGKPVRTLHLAASVGGGEVVERIEELDAHALRLTYRIIDAGPVPITSYRGTFSLKAQPAGGTRLRYSAEFDGPDPAWLAATAKENFRIYSSNLARLVGAPPPECESAPPLAAEPRAGPDSP